MVNLTTEIKLVSLEAGCYFTRLNQSVIRCTLNAMVSLNQLDNNIESLSDALTEVLNQLKRKHLDLQKEQSVPAVRYHQVEGVNVYLFTI